MKFNQADSGLVFLLAVCTIVMIHLKLFKVKKIQKLLHLNLTSTVCVKWHAKIGNKDQKEVAPQQ